MVTPSPPGDRWRHPTATPPGVSGHCGHPILTLGTPHGRCLREPWAPWSPHPHPWDTPWPPLQRGLCTMVPPSPSWGHPMAVALWGSGHRGPPILTLGAHRGHPTTTPPGVSGHHGPLILTLGTAGDTPWPWLWGDLGTVVPPSPLWGRPTATAVGTPRTRSRVGATDGPGVIRAPLPAAPPGILGATEAPLCCEQTGKRRPWLGGRWQWGGCRAVPCPPSRAVTASSPLADVAGRAGEALQDAERADLAVPAAQPGPGVHPALPRREGQGEGEHGGQGLFG